MPRITDPSFPTATSATLNTDEVLGIVNNAVKNIPLTVLQSVLGAGGSNVTVVDNLNSTSTTAALSANQGKMLNDALAAKADLSALSGYATTAQAKAEYLTVACSDESTAITTGTAKITFRMPYAMTLTAVRANVNTASSSGVVTIDINENGSSILGTKLTIDANEKTSTTASSSATISDSNLSDDAEITVDFDTAGTGAKGVKITLIGTRV